MIKNVQPPWVAYIVKYIFVIRLFSSLSRALARISPRIPAFLCRAAQCRDAFKAEVSLDVGSGSDIRLSKCAGFEKSLYSSMARKTGGCNPEKLFSENIFLLERSIKASSWVIGKVQGRFLIKTGCLEDYIFRRAPPDRDPQKSLLTYTWQKNMGVFGKNELFCRIYFTAGCARLRSQPRSHEKSL